MSDTQDVLKARPKGCFIERRGIRCAGVHLLIDLHEAERIDDLRHVEATLIQCAEAARASILHAHLHRFTPTGGISGVLVLAESHISIHTWPEHRYAALDIFLCGKTRPMAAVDVLREAFHAERVVVEEHLRGSDPISRDLTIQQVRSIRSGKSPKEMRNGRPEPHARGVRKMDSGSLG